MTKEEIWNKNVPGWKLGMTDKGYANALVAMDEYAKQQSIEFNGYLSHNQSEETREFLQHAYNQFIEQQNKQK